MTTRVIIVDDLRTIHNAQLVYSNCKDMPLTLLTGFKIWLVHNCLLYNAGTLLGNICVINNNKLNIHPRGMAIFRKSIQTYSQTVEHLNQLFRRRAADDDDLRGLIADAPSKTQLKKISNY